MLAAFQEDYNTVRPHSGLGNLPPTPYAKLSAPHMQRAGALELPAGSAPRPVASPSHTGSNEAGTLPSLDERRGSGHHEREAADHLTLHDIIESNRRPPRLVRAQ